MKKKQKALPRELDYRDLSPQSKILTEKMLRLLSDFDQKCEQIFSMMVVCDLDKQKMRYNELFRHIEKVLNISKPTFNEHIGHLIEKKIVVHEQLSKQMVYLSLDPESILVKETEEMKRAMDEEAEILRGMMNKPDFFKDLETYPALWFALVELRRHKINFVAAINPEISREDLLAVSIQNKILLEMENQVIRKLLRTIYIAKPEEEEKIIGGVLTSLDNAINDVKKELANYSNPNPKV